VASDEDSQTECFGTAKLVL